MNTNNVKSEVKDATNRAAHSAAADKASGHSKQVIGGIKEKVGNFIGDDQLAAKGSMQRADGKKDEIKGEIKEKVENVKDTVKAGVDVVKEKLHGENSKR